MKEIKKSHLPDVKTSLPGPKSKMLIEKYIKYFGDIRRPRLAVKKAYGCIIEDVDDNKFLAFSQAADVLGYSNPEIIAASIHQMKKMISRGVASPSLLDFTEILLKKLPGELCQGRVNYVASGTEAVELAAVLAREYSKRPLLLSYHDSHHGYMGTPFQLSGDPRIKKSWTARINDIIHIPYPKCYRCEFEKRYPDCDLLCLRYLESIFETVASPDQIAGLLIEPILVNGGLYVPPDEYMRRLMDICQKNEIQLIDDEVFTGMGKSGKFLAANHWSITPDILCLAKAMGGGFPLAAVVTKREVTDNTRGGVKFTGTFQANLVACAASIATMEYIEKHRLAENAEKVGNFLIRSLKDMSERKSSIGDVRGRGLLIGVDLVENKETRDPASDESSRIVEKACDNGLLIRSVGRYGNILLLTPPLTLSFEQAEKGVEILDKLIN